MCTSYLCKKLNAKMNRYPESDDDIYQYDSNIVGCKKILEARCAA